MTVPVLKYIKTTLAYDMTVHVPVLSEILHKINIHLCLH